MSACDQIFQSWNEHLDSITVGKQTDLQLQIRHQINRLQDQFQTGLLAMENIIEVHQCLNETMAEQLQQTAESDGQLKPDSRVLEMGNTIRQCSAAVSQHLASMNKNLSALVFTLEKSR
ncbi:hypothetical protein BKA93DRAFT_824076 [Sparassis latifolia]